MTPVSDLSGFVVPTWLFFGVLGVAVLLAVVLIAGMVYRRRRRTQDDLVYGITAVRFDASVWHPDRRTDLEKQHAELKGQYEDLTRNYEVLLARHRALIREFERREQSLPASPRRTSPAMRFGTRT